MKYYVMIVQKSESGNACAVYEKNTLDEARVQFHTELASAMSSTTLVGALVSIINENGEIVDGYSEKWDK